MFTLKAAKKAARLRIRREERQQDMQDPVYRAAEQERQRLAYLTRKGVVTPGKVTT